MLNIALFGQRIRFGTGISINPKAWNAEKQEPRASDPHRNAHSKRLRTITNSVNEVYNDLHIQGIGSNARIELINHFKIQIESILSKKAVTPPTAVDLFADFEQFINSHTLRSSSGLVTTVRPRERTLSMYRLVKQSLIEFELHRSTTISYESITLEFLASYVQWIGSNRNLSDASASNFIKVIKTFMKWAKHNRLHDSTEYERFHRDKRTGETVALSADEIRTIRDLDLSDSPRLSRVRDHFLLQCYTGMRYGDLMQLEPRHFDDEIGVIRFTTTKTNTKCIIPITRPIRTLLARYPSRIFEFASDVKQNLYLKELAVKAGFNKEISIAQYRGGRRVETVKPKHELITTHVARRSFASTSVRFGVPESVIAIVTGHSAKGMLQQHYIKLDEEAVRDIVVNAWDQL